MPVGRVKRRERPDKSRAGNTAIHHRIFLDVRWVIETDELMPDYLRVNCERDCSQNDQDDEIGSRECCSMTWRDCASGVGCCGTTSLSFSRDSFRHARL